MARPAVLWSDVFEAGAFGHFPRNDLALQFCGKGEDSLSLRGTVYRHYHGGLRQVQALREAADGGDPLPLVTGYGDYLGMWAIVKVEETQSEPTLTGRR